MGSAFHVDSNLLLQWYKRKEQCRNEILLLCLLSGTFVAFICYLLFLRTWNLVLNYTNYYIYEEVASTDDVITGLTAEEGAYQTNDRFIPNEKENEVSWLFVIFILIQSIHCWMDPTK